MTNIIYALILSLFLAKQVLSPKNFDSYSMAETEINLSLEEK